MEPTLTVNGVSLDGLGYNVTSRTGWRSFPGVRATTIATSNADGVLVPNRRAPLEPGTLNLSMYVTGENYVEFTERIDTLMAVFSTPDGTVPVELNLDPEEGLIRTCQARTLAAWAVGHEGPLQADFSVVMEIPSGTWTTTGYAIARRVNFGDPLFVECQNPTYSITDSILLIRDPNIIVDFTVTDTHSDFEYGYRPSVSLLLASPVPSNRSLLFDFGRWSAGLIARPDVDEVDEGWFDNLPVYQTDLTSSLVRRGPMYGGSLLSLKPGETPLVPRIPGVHIDGVDGAGIPDPISDATLAVKPRWV